MHTPKIPKTVAIIGAGIAGLYLAWKLSEAGHEVTVFEKKEKVGGKICSSLISERIKNFISFEQSLIGNQINSCLIHFPKKTITLSLKPVHFVINRQNLIELLFGLAKKSGATILFNQPAERTPPNFEKVIGTDGALSKIRENLSLPKPSFRLGLQFFLPIGDSSDFVETWPKNRGFFWKIPRGKEVEYGALGNLNLIRKEFEEFCKEQKIDTKGIEVKSAMVPQGLIIPNNENITLCGDAAGFTKPWSGGGIIWGLTAADILVKSFPSFKEYHKRAKSFFQSKIFFGNLSNKIVHFTGEKLPFFLPSKIIYDNDFLRIRF